MATIVNQVMGLGSYRQRAGGSWVTEKYKFGWQDGLFSNLGCTPTSITNILVWATRGSGTTAPNPSNTNNKDDTFYTAFRKADFKDLSYQGNRVYEEPLWRIQVDLFGSWIEKGSLSGGRLVERIKNSIRVGKPVLIGLRPSLRHSIVGGGIDSDGNILVIDPWYGFGGNDSSGYAAFQTLQQSMGKSYNSFDMAYEVSRV